MGSHRGALSARALALALPAALLLLATSVSGNARLEKELVDAVEAIKKDDKFSLVGKHIGNVSEYLSK